MDRVRSQDLEEILDNLYAHWRNVRRETIDGIGEKEALKIIDFHANNWIDIIGWISASYEKCEQMDIVNFQFSRVFKEIYWLQYLFLAGNYPAMYRNLRFLWEMMAQAYYVDSQYPNIRLDEQFAEARLIEDHKQSWNIIQPALCRVLKKSGNKVESQFKPLWSELNRHVHPSVKQLDMIAEEDFSSLVTDSFHEALAKEVLKVTDSVLDLVYAIVLRKFNRVSELAKNYKFINEWEGCLPNSISVIHNV